MCLISCFPCNAESLKYRKRQRELFNKQKSQALDSLPLCHQACGDAPRFKGTEQVPESCHVIHLWHPRMEPFSAAEACGIDVAAKESKHQASSGVKASGMERRRPVFCISIFRNTENKSIVISGWEKWAYHTLRAWRKASLGRGRKLKGFDTKQNKTPKHFPTYLVKGFHWGLSAGVAGWLC